MRGLKTDRTASILIREDALIQNVRRGQFQQEVETGPAYRQETSFDELPFVI